MFNVVDVGFNLFQSNKFLDLLKNLIWILSKQKNIEKSENKLIKLFNKNNNSLTNLI